MENKTNIDLEKLVKEEKQAREQEIESILLKASESKEESLFFAENGDIEIRNEIESLLDQQIDDPDEKYELYYNVINKVLRDYLPKGKENESARNIIYEEKNTYLTRGRRKDDKGLRHADSRMSYNADLKALVDIVVDWASTNRNPFSLYVRLRDLNKSMGYGVPSVEK